MPALAPKAFSQSVRKQAIARTLRRSFVVNLEHGLHARPCALLINTLRPFRSDVLVECEGVQVSGRSILGLMMLAARCGSTITFTVMGDDAPDAMDAVAYLFSTEFAEAYSRAKSTRKTWNL